MIDALTWSAFSLGDHLLERARREDVDVEQEQLLVRDLLGVREARRASRARACARSRPARRCPSGCAARPLESETATTVAPSSCRKLREIASRRCRSPARRRVIAVEPAVAASRPRRGCSRGAPRAVASSRPSEPPIVSGLPVTTPSTEWPLFIEYVSKIHAITRAVGADVGRGDVLLRADLVDDLARVAARHPLELGARELLRVDDDAALRAAERDAHERALPRHPHRERLDLVERDVRVVADAALRRAARDVVRDAVALEDVASSRRPCRPGSRPRPPSCTAPRTSTRFGSMSKVVCDPPQLLPRDLERVLAKMRDRCVDRRHRVGRVYGGSLDGKVSFRGSARPAATG